MAFELWSVSQQPDILGGRGSFADITWTYPEIIEHLYEPLRARYPEYMTRRVIGRDTTGEYEIWAYEWTPAHYDRTIYIQSGVHVIETEGYFGLARLMTMIAEGEDERLRAVREHVRLLLVPCVSVWGVSKKGGYEGLMADKRHQIPHNAAMVNPNRDDADEKAAETTAVKRYFAANADGIDFAFDFHTTTETGWGAYLMPYADGLSEDIAERHKAINRALYAKNKTDYPQAYMGVETHYPRGGIHNSFIGGFFRNFGVPAMTIEHNDYIYDPRLGTSKAMTLAVELYGNHLLAEAELSAR